MDPIPKLTLQDWLDRITQEEMPVFGRTAQDVAKVTASESSSVAALSQVILQDAAMTARVLKLANSALYNPGLRSISTISRAIIVLGFETVRDMAISVGVVEAMLKAKARARVAREMALAFHAAVQARAMAVARRDTAPEEVFIAALLYRLGDMAFWCAAGEAGERLEAALQEPGVSPAQAEERVLGFPLKHLTRGLAREWRLNALLQQVLEGRVEKAGREYAVVLSRQLAESVEGGWDCPEADSLFESVARFTRTQADQVREALIENAKQAAEVAGAYGAAFAIRHLPQQPSSPQIEKQASAAAEPSPAFYEPDPLLQLKILRELAAILNHKPDINLLLEMVLEGIYRGVGMDRTLFALLSPNRRFLKAKFVLGADRAGLSDAFHFELQPDRPHLFSQVLQRQECAWIREAPGTTEKRLLSPAITRVVGEGTAFLVMPIVVNGQSIGIFYADRRSSGRALDEDSFESFKLFGQQANLGLGHLTGRG